MVHMRIGLLFCATLLIFTLPLNAGEGLSMRVRPTVAMAPATVTVVVRVESDRENRALEVVAESEEFFRSSQVQLDGADARRVNTFEFRDLPSGAYQVSGRVTRADGRQLAVTNSLKVTWGVRSSR